MRLCYPLTSVLSLVILFTVTHSSATDDDISKAAAVSEIEMRGIGWHVLRSHNPLKLAEFYLALGFREWASSERIIGLHAGGGAAIEIGYLDETTPANPRINSRTQSSAAVIFGTSDAARVAQKARDAGATFVETWTSGDVTLYYIGDPEGNVIGFAEDGPMWGNTEELRRLGIEPKNVD